MLKTTFIGLSVCFQTHGEEVFGPQKHTENTCSGGIWKTRVSFLDYVYHFESFVATCVPGTNVYFSEGNIFLQRFLTDTSLISLIVWKIPKNWCKSESSRTSFITKGLIQASTPRMLKNTSWLRLLTLLPIAKDQTS